MKNVTSVNDCKSSCLQNRECLWFAYDQTSNECFLKSEMADKNYNADFISGPRQCSGQHDLLNEAVSWGRINLRIRS